MQFEFRGASIYYEDIGQGDVVVLMHGWGGHSKTVKCMSNAFHTKRVIMFDFPPFGNSSEPPEDWSLCDYTDALIACLEMLGINSADFVGHSFGGRVGIDLASRTKLAQKLVLVDAAGVRPKRTLKKIWKSWRFRRAKRKGRDTEKYYSTDYLALSQPMRKVFSRIVSEDLTNRLAKIECETLIIWGADDKETPLYMAKTMNRKIPNSGLVVLDGGHYSYIDSPSDFLMTLVSFLGI